MNFQQLVAYKPQIEAELRRQYASARRSARPVFRPYLDLLREYTLRGGKRFRALLVLAGYHLATRRDPAPVLSAAAALEHFQSWMLIHDDLIDHSEARRGGPTLHRSLARQHAAEGGLGASGEYGVGLGITLGDLEEPLTVAALRAPIVPERRRADALAEYVRMTRETAFGQVLDIRNGSRPVPEVREQDVLLVHELKSAFYTVACPLRIGASLGGAPASLMRRLEEIGVDLGIAFQLRDDVLGAGLGPGDPGKSANDLLEGKRTLLVVRAWAEADVEGRALIDRVLGQPGAPRAEVDALRELLRTSGSLAYSERKIAGLRQRASRRIASCPGVDRAGRGLLEEIGDRLVDRSV